MLFKLFLASLMNAGKKLFAQLIDFLPLDDVQLDYRRLDGDSRPLRNGKDATLVSWSSVTKGEVTGDNASSPGFL
jgi:hypothetical protein